MSKKYLLIIFFLLPLFTGIWYFVLKNHDYSISFKANQIPGEVYQKLLVYDYENLSKLKVTEQIPYNEIDQTAKINDVGIHLNWHIKEENDSLSRVKVFVTQENKFQSRLQMLTGKNEIQKIIAKEVERLKLALDLDREQYKVEITGTAIPPSATCACISLENKIDHKAGDMMKNIGLLASFFKENELEMAGKPRIQVNEWDLKTNGISYEFCFPFVPTKLINPPSNIYIKEFASQNSIHAIYNGNYMYSHLAWIRILNYAKKNDHEIINSPLEIFQENPEFGGDSRFWRADIYMPLK